jgi:hypothetical protein
MKTFFNPVVCIEIGYLKKVKRDDRPSAGMDRFLAGLKKNPPGAFSSRRLFGIYQHNSHCGLYKTDHKPRGHVRFLKALLISP